MRRSLRVFMMFMLTVFTAGVLALPVFAEPIDLGEVVLREGEKVEDFDALVQDRVFYSVIGDNDQLPSRWYPTAASRDEMQDKEYFNISEVDEYTSSLTAKKAGSLSMIFTGTTTVDIDVETKKDVTYEVALTITVRSASSVKKNAAAAAKSLLAKKGSSKKFVYADFTYDGIKDLIVGGQLYVYNTQTGKYFLFTGQGKRKIESVMQNKKTKEIMLVTKGTLSLKAVTTDENKKYVSKAYIKLYPNNPIFFMGNGYSITNTDEPYFASLTAAGKKIYKTKKTYAYFGEEYFEDEEGNPDFRGDAFMGGASNAAFKAYKKNFTTVKMYKNTSANRKKYVK